MQGLLEQLLSRHRGAELSAGVADGELLRRYSTTRDEAAFELLVWRHGAMVLGVCRRMIRDEQLAEDAFQAVFIVLARKAGTIRGGNVGGWLFRVARRVGARAFRKRSNPQELPEVAAACSPSAAEHQELAELIDAEVERLPDRLRQTVTLCYLGGYTTEEAARELGCPRGTVLSRLAAARERLAARLSRRGVSLPAAGIAGWNLTTERLVSQTVALARAPADPLTQSGPLLLAKSVVRAMIATKLVTVSCIALLATCLTFGIGWVAAATDAQERGSEITNTAQKHAQPPSAAKANPGQDAKPGDKAATLRNASEMIARRIDELRLAIISEAAKTDLIDVSILQSELLALDKEIYDTEKMTKSYPRSIERATQEKEAAAKETVDENAVLQTIEEHPEVKKALGWLSNATSAVRSLQGKFSAVAPEMEAAKKEVSAAQTALENTRAKLRPQAEEKLRAARTAALTANVAELKRLSKHYAENLKASREERSQLVERIAHIQRANAKQQMLQDQLSVLREIQLAILREQTRRELGIEWLPVAPLKTASEPSIADLRLEVERLREIVEKRKKSR